MRILKIASPLNLPVCRWLLAAVLLLLTLSLPFESKGKEGEALSFSRMQAKPVQQGMTLVGGPSPFFEYKILAQTNVPKFAEIELSTLSMIKVWWHLSPTISHFTSTSTLLMPLWTVTFDSVLVSISSSEDKIS